MTSLFENVLSMSLSAGFLVGMIALFRICFRRVPKWVHCILWVLVAVRLLIPALPRSNLSMVPERVSNSGAIVDFVAEMPQFAPLPQTSAPEVQTPVWENAPMEAPVFSPAPQTPPQFIDWMAVLAKVWLTGVLLMGLYGVFSYVRVRRRVAASVHVGGGVYLCDYISTPFLLGLVRPRIYLPSRLDTDTAGFVLSHERAHLARRDHWWKPLGFALLSFHWFNPMIWLGYILLCRDIEMACDEAVIRTMGAADKKGYSTALLKCSLPRRMVSICPLAFGEVSVKERIKSVLNYKRPALWLSILGIAAVIFGAIFFLTDPEQEAKEPGEVEFHPTAEYSDNNDFLVLYEYDRDFRVKKIASYGDGKLGSVHEYSYQESGNKRIETETTTAYQEKSTPDGFRTVETVMENVTYEELDEKGNVLSRTYYQNGELQTTAHFTYDENGNELLMQMDDDYVSYQKECTYDDQGNPLTEVRRFDRDRDGIYENMNKTLWTYDAEGRVSTWAAYSGDKKTIQYSHAYDDQGRISTEREENVDGLVRIHTFRYDEENHTRIREITFEDGTLDFQEVIQYDEYDNILSTTTFDRWGQTLSCTNYIGTDGTKSIGIPEDIYTEGGKILDHEPARTWSQDERITLEVVNVTPIGADLCWKIDAGIQFSDFSVGNPFTLERKTETGWEDLENSYNVGWNPAPVTGQTFSEGFYYTPFSVSWAELYGILPAGDYRITTSLSSFGSKCSAEFTIPENGNEFGQAALDDAMEALRRLVTGSYLVETNFGGESHRINLKSGRNFLQTYYAGSIPTGGSLRFGGLNYIRRAGNWVFNNGAVDMGLTQWYVPYVYSPDRLTLKKDETKEGLRTIVFTVIGEEDQTDHTLIFRLDKDSNLTEIKETGYMRPTGSTPNYTAYETVTAVLTTDEDQVKQRLSQEDLNKCASFHWNLEEVTGDNIRTEGFKNTAKAKIDGILRVYRLAEKEFQPEYTTAQVFRDEENDMWKVEFRTDSGAGGCVYLDGSGITKLVDIDTLEELENKQASSALADCKRVLNEVQGRDHWRIHSHYDWRGRALNDWTDTTYWLRGLDWMHKSKLQDGDGYAVFGNMWVDGRYFDNDGYGWSENDEPYYQEKTPPEEVYRYPAPWLVSCNWDSYVIQLLSETEDDSGRSVRLHMIPKDGIQDLEEYDVTFFFDSEGSFQKAVIDTVEGFQAVTRETTTIDSLAWNRISAEIDGEYEYAVAINEETDPADWPDVDNCLAVVKGIQDRDHWRIRTYYNNDPWSETTLWLRGADWMEQTRLPGTGQGLVYSEMHQNGRFFKSGPRVWSDNFVPSWKEAAFPGEQEHFANVPWLISCDWELYDIAPAYRTQDAAGFSVRLKMTSRDRETAPDDYDVTFHFDLEGNFVKADLLVLDGQTQVSHQIIYIESTDRDEISAQMDKEYQRATK